MKFTEGAFKEWGYQVAQEFGAELLDGGPWMTLKIQKQVEKSSLKTALPMRFYKKFCFTQRSTM